MSEEYKTSLEFYSKLKNKLDKILNGEMSLEDYSKEINLKIEMILECKKSTSKIKYYQNRIKESDIETAPIHAELYDVTHDTNSNADVLP